MIAASVGLANNYGALKSLITKGIQTGHMKMHLLNILNFYHATHDEKAKAMEFFDDKKVSFTTVTDYLNTLRSESLLGIKS